MKFIVTENYEAMSRTAARVISGYVSSHPDCVLGLATGSTPIGLYRCLVEDCEAGALSFKDVTSFNLDEYRGLDPQHDQSYRYFMEHNLFSHVDIDPARTHVPDGACPDADAACAAYEQAIAEAVAAYVDAHRDEYQLIVTTQDWHIDPGEHFSENPDFVDTWPKHGAAGTLNAELHPAIKALNIEHHFKKGQYSAAYSGFEGIEDNTDRIQTREEVEAEQSAGKTLANALKAAGVSRVDVVGIAESHCVKDTALDAKKLGFEVTVFEDLTVPVSEELGVAARKQMAAGGITLAESR